MAFNITCTRLFPTNIPQPISTGASKWCFGLINFGAGDTYVTNGFDIRPFIRKAFGVEHVHAIQFLNYLTAASGSANTGGTYQARYSMQQLSTTVAPPNGHAAGFVRIFEIGRTITAGAAVQSETEMANGDSLANLQYQFMAICSGEGASYDQSGNSF